MREMNPAYPYVDTDGRLGLHGEALRHRALKGPNISAQGNALGILKGRHTIRTTSKTQERQSLMNSHQQSWWFNL